MIRKLSILIGLWVLCGFALAQAPGQPSAVILVDCDRDCLISKARDYIKALRAKDTSLAAFSKDVRFTEDNVEMPLGNHGLWGTISDVRDGALEVADEETGNALWSGIVEEHGHAAYLAVRIKVENKQITEVETVVNRWPGWNPDRAKSSPSLPKPFGDPDKVVHDEAFNEITPEDERVSRARLVAIADGYFNTVELNDGKIFTPFHDDCGRLENGISTTAGGVGSANYAQGCEEQFKLGIFKINKRIRERRYPIVDVERQVVVASGFFDHANEFDRYKLTNGQEMRTALKWPNSITLLEAFKVKDGKIYRIEAIFTYVPYFMHSPFAKPNLDFQTR